MIAQAINPTTIRMPPPINPRISQLSPISAPFDMLNAGQGNPSGQSRRFPEPHTHDAMIPNHAPDGPDDLRDRRSAPSITVSLSHLPYYLALLIIVGIAWTGISKASQLVDAVHASTVANNELQGKLDLLSTKIDGLSDRVTRLENSATTTVVVPRGRP